MIPMSLFHEVYGLCPKLKYFFSPCSHLYVLCCKFRLSWICQLDLELLFYRIVLYLWRTHFFSLQIICQVLVVAEVVFSFLVVLVLVFSRFF